MARRRAWRLRSGSITRKGTIRYAVATAFFAVVVGGVVDEKESKSIPVVVTADF